MSSKLFSVIAAGSLAGSGSLPTATALLGSCASCGKRNRVNIGLNINENSQKHGLDALAYGLFPEEYNALAYGRFPGVYDNQATPNTSKLDSFCLFYYSDRCPPSVNLRDHLKTLEKDNGGVLPSELCGEEGRIKWINWTAAMDQSDADSDAHSDVSSLMRQDEIQKQTQLLEKVVGDLKKNDTTEDETGQVNQAKASDFPWEKETTPFLVRVERNPESNAWIIPEEGRDEKLKFTVWNTVPKSLAFEPVVLAEDYTDADVDSNDSWFLSNTSKSQPRVAFFNSLAMGHFLPARKIVHAVAKAGAKVHYFHNDNAQKAKLKTMIPDERLYQEMEYFPSMDLPSVEDFLGKDDDFSRKDDEITDGVEDDDNDDYNHNQGYHNQVYSYSIVLNTVNRILNTNYSWNSTFGAGVKVWLYALGVGSRQTGAFPWGLEIDEIQALELRHELGIGRGKDIHMDLKVKATIARLLLQEWLNYLIFTCKKSNIDLVIGETHAPWGKVVANALNVPYITMNPMRGWDNEASIGQVFSEMDDSPESPWYTPGIEGVKGIEALIEKSKSYGETKHSHGFATKTSETGMYLLSDKAYENAIQNQLHQISNPRTPEEGIPFTITVDGYQSQKDALSDTISKTLTITPSISGWEEPDSVSYMGVLSKYVIQFSGEAWIGKEDVVKGASKKKNSSSSNRISSVWNNITSMFSMFKLSKAKETAAKTSPFVRNGNGKVWAVGPNAFGPFFEPQPAVSSGKDGEDPIERLLTPLAARTGESSGRTGGYDTKALKFFLNNHIESTVSVDKNTGMKTNSQNDRRVLYVALGTVDGAPTTFFDAVVEAMCKNAGKKDDNGNDILQNFTLVLALGSAFKNNPNEKQRLLNIAKENIDPNTGVQHCFVTESFVNQMKILPKANVFLSHMGMGSLQEAVRYGVPVLMLPTDPERYGNALVAKELGVGEFLLDEFDPDHVNYVNGGRKGKKKNIKISPRMSWWKEKISRGLMGETAVSGDSENEDVSNPCPVRVNSIVAKVADKVNNMFENANKKGHKMQIGLQYVREDALKAHESLGESIREVLELVGEGYQG